MVREFGPKIDSRVYGKAALKVEEGQRGPEFVWSKIRSEDFEQRGFLLDS
jgi:hypothetical protein